MRTDSFFRKRGFPLALTGSLILAGCVGSRDPQIRPPGDEASMKTEALKLGAKMLQKDSPLDPINVYLVGFHPMKTDPAHQMEAHHFVNRLTKTLPSVSCSMGIPEALT